MPLYLPPLPPPHEPASSRAAQPVRADFLTEQEALALFFPTADRFEKKLVIVPKDTELGLRRGRTPRHYFRNEAWHETERLGFAVVDEVLGKARPITYLVAMDLGPKVLGVELLAYRESHGGEIGRAAFRDQFRGRQADDALRLGGDIRNIAGATISCRAITDGVADMLDLIHATLPLPTSSVATPSDSPTAAEAEAEAPGRLARVRVLMNAPLAIQLELGADSDRDRAIAATQAAYLEVERLDGILSLFQPDSDPARLAVAASGDWVPLRPATAELLERALRVAALSGGAVTPLAGPLTQLARRAPAAGEAARSAAAKLSASHLLELDPSAPERARFLRRGMGLDFGASGKGFTLDRVRRSLRAAGFEHGTLDFGGQLLALGSDPLPVELPGGATVVLASGSLATTGDGERGLGGSHLFDARNGAPVQPHGAVTVFAAEALDADLWSSALYVLGPEAGLALAEAQGVAARFEAGTQGTTVQPASVESTAWRARFDPER